jgi:hypothetical protein
MKKLTSSILAAVVALAGACAQVDGEDVDIQQTEQHLDLGSHTFYPSYSNARIPFSATWYNSDITIGVGSDTVNTVYPPYDVPVAQCVNPNSPFYARYKIKATDTNPATLDNNIQWSWDIQWSTWPATVPTSHLLVHLCRVMAPYGAVSQAASPPASFDCIDVSTQKTGGTTRWNALQFDKVQGHPHFVLVFAISDFGVSQINPVVQFDLSKTFVKMFVTRAGTPTCAY